MSVSTSSINVKKKKVLVYGLNYSPELTGIGKYTGKMCVYLAGCEGIDVRAVVSQPYYPQWKIEDDYPNRYSVKETDSVRVYRCPLYVPGNPNKYKRTIHLLSFAASSIPAMIAQLKWRPDIVIVIAPSIFCAPIGLIFALLYRAKSQLHIQDFELSILSNILSGKSRMLLSVFNKLESGLFKAFGRMSTISGNMKETLVAAGVLENNIFVYPNGVDTGVFSPQRPVTNLKNDFTDLGVSAENYCVVYSGNIGEKQGLGTLIETALLLKHLPAISILIVGEGAAKAKLYDEIQKNSLHSISMCGLIDEKDFPRFLNAIDLHLILQKIGVADSVMPSKLSAILAVGGECIVAAETGTQLDKIQQSHKGIYTFIQPENAKVLAEEIEKQYHLWDTHTNSGKTARRVNAVARQYAEKYLAESEIFSQLQHDLSQYE